MQVSLDDSQTQQDLQETMKLEIDSLKVREILILLFRILSFRMKSKHRKNHMKIVADK
jgi:hypothetical protein